MKQRGSFVISLDFELLWGVIELPNCKSYAESNVKNVPAVIDKMLKLFEKYDVKATFATVGLLMCTDKEEAEKYFPNQKPSYSNKSLTPYGDYFKSISPRDNTLYFASDIVEKLKSSKCVEIGTHTFCHYYCWEDGQTIEQFDADIKAAVKLASEKGIRLKSIVFPRNNVSEEYLKVCKENGIISYRGNTRKFFGKPKNRLFWYKNRLARLLDSYLPISGHNTYCFEDLAITEDLPVNIPASRLFRPYSKLLSFLEPIRINRIKLEIKHAAKNGEMYHLWWHPHNFGENMAENLKNLDSILKYMAVCREKYGIQSYTMSEFANTLISQ